MQKFSKNTVEQIFELFPELAHKSRPNIVWVFSSTASAWFEFLWSVKTDVGLDFDATTSNALFEAGSIVVHEKVAAIGFLKIWNDLLKEELVRSYKGSKLANL